MDNGRTIPIQSNGSSVPARKGQPIMLTAKPVADIYESHGAFVVSLDLPGSTKDQIEVLVEPGFLAVRGTVSARQEQDGRMLHREIGWNRYEREFKIGPGIDEKQITAEFNDGVLTVVLPKTEDARSRTIAIK